MPYACYPSDNPDSLTTGQGHNGAYHCNSKRPNPGFSDDPQHLPGGPPPTGDGSGGGGGVDPGPPQQQPVTLDVLLGERISLRNGQPRATDKVFGRSVTQRALTAERWSEETAVFSVPREAVLAPADDALSSQLLIQDFDLNVPPGSSILGIEVCVMGRKATGSVTEHSISLVTGSYGYQPEAAVFGGDNIGYFDVGGVRQSAEASMDTLAGTASYKEPTAFAYDGDIYIAADVGLDVYNWYRSADGVTWASGGLDPTEGDGLEDIFNFWHAGSYFYAFCGYNDGGGYRAGLYRSATVDGTWSKLANTPSSTNCEILAESRVMYLSETACCIRACTNDTTASNESRYWHTSDGNAWTYETDDDNGRAEPSSNGLPRLYNPFIEDNFAMLVFDPVRNQVLGMEVDDEKFVIKASAPGLPSFSAIGHAPYFYSEGVEDPDNYCFARHMFGSTYFYIIDAGGLTSYVFKVTSSSVQNITDTWQTDIAAPFLDEGAEPENLARNYLAVRSGTMGPFNQGHMEPSTFFFAE